MTDFHQYRAKVTGYSPGSNRYFVRLTAPVGKVPTSDWNQQKPQILVTQHVQTNTMQQEQDWHIILLTKPLEPLVE